MLTVIGFIVIIVFGVLYLIGSNIDKDVDPKDKLNEKENSFVPKTGYSFIDFELVKSTDLCDESQELYNNIKEGDFLTCMICPYREQGEVYINVGWFEVGKVDKHNRDEIFYKVNAANYLYCQCIKVLEENDVKRHFCRYVYFDSEGTFDIQNEMSHAVSSSTVISEKEVSDNIDMNNFVWIMPTGQLVSNLRDEYYKGGIPKYGSDTEAVIEEDNCFIIQFVKDYLRGCINSLDDKSDFIRDCTSDRVYGDSKMLKRRINLYIKDTGLEFIN